MKRTTHTSYRIGFSCGLSLSSISAYRDAAKFNIPHPHFSAFRRGYLEGREIMIDISRENKNTPLPSLIVG